MRRLLTFAVLAVIGYGVWQKQHSHPDERAAYELSKRQEYSANQNLVETPSSSQMEAYVCDGRTRCNEMTSCGEALYFLQHCPGVKMDGDGDGVPCEDQHCSHMR